MHILFSGYWIFLLHRFLESIYGDMNGNIHYNISIFTTPLDRRQSICTAHILDILFVSRSRLDPHFFSDHTFPAHTTAVYKRIGFRLPAVLDSSHIIDTFRLSKIKHLSDVESQYVLYNCSLFSLTSYKSSD